LIVRLLVAAYRRVGSSSSRDFGLGRTRPAGQTGVHLAETCAGL